MLVHESVPHHQYSIWPMRPFLAFAGSWRKYAAGCRMRVYVRTFRHEVGKTYTVLGEAQDDGGCST